MAGNDATAGYLADLSVDHRITIDREGEKYLLIVQPVGRFGGAPRTYRGTKLATIVLRAWGGEPGDAP